MLLLSVVYLAIYAKFIYPIEIFDIWPQKSRPEVNRHLNFYEDSTGAGDEDPEQPENE